MVALQIIKEIYLSPRQAFEVERLERTFHQALAWFAASNVIEVFLFYILKKSTTSLWSEFLIKVLSIVAGLVVLWPMAWLGRLLVRRNGSDFTWHSYVSGYLWIVVALTPFSLLFVFKGSILLASLTAALCLSTLYSIFLLQQVSHLSFRTSLKIYIQAFLILTIPFILVGIIVGLLYLKFAGPK